MGPRHNKFLNELLVHMRQNIFLPHELSRAGSVTTPTIEWTDTYQDIAKVHENTGRNRVW